MSQGKVKVGEVYNRLTAVSFIGVVKSQARWLWQCSCGKQIEAAAGKVRYGSTKSCGCYSADIASNRLKKHGMFGTPTYDSWAGMIQRCYNTNNDRYSSYGGRGITVCDRWRDSFEAFMEDMGERPEGMTIDRENTNGNYEPSNCRWATAKTQAENRRTALFVILDGVEMNASVAAKKLGVEISLFYSRLNQGYTADEIATPGAVDLTKQQGKRTLVRNDVDRLLMVIRSTDKIEDHMNGRSFKIITKQYQSNDLSVVYDVITMRE